MRSKELETSTTVEPGRPMPIFCAANGCPMAGTYGSHTTTVSNPRYWCGFHTGVNEKRTPEITHLINQNINLIRAAYAIMLVPVSPHLPEILESFGASMVRAGRPEFAPKENEYPFNLGYRILQQLQNEISGDKRERHEEKSDETLPEVKNLRGILDSLEIA